jgi:hypothetical protein
LSPTGIFKRNRRKPLKKTNCCFDVLFFFYSPTDVIDFVILKYICRTDSVFLSMIEINEKKEEEERRRKNQHMKVF